MNIIYNMSSLMSTNIGDPTKNIQLDAVPYNLSSSRLPMPMQTANRIIQIPCSFGNQFSLNSGGSQLQFIVPTGAGTGYLRNQSCYLRYKIFFTDATNTTWNFGGPTADGCSIFGNVRAMVGGCQVENINNYSNYHQTMLGHFTNKSYVERVSNILSASLQDGTSTATGGGANTLQNVIDGGIGAIKLSANVGYSITVPLCLNMLNGTKSLPLFLMGSSPLQIQLDLAPLSLAIQTASTTYTNVIITDPMLVYEEVRVAPVVEMAILETMKNEGKMYELPLITATGYNQTVLANQPLTFYQSVNLKSMLGILYMAQTTANQAITASKYFTKYYTDTTAPTHRLILDGSQWNNVQLQYDSSLFAMMASVGTSLFNSNVCTRHNTAVRSSTTANAVSSYTGRSFVNGFSTKAYLENNLIGTGKSVGNLNLYIDSNTNSGANFYIYVVHQATMLIDGYGNVSLLR